MAIVSVHGFRTAPGRLSEHLATAAEALGHLRRLGLQAINLQTLAGGDVGVLTTVINHASNADYAAAQQALMADAEWLGFSQRAADSGVADPVESSLFTDLDVTFQPSADRPLGAILVTQWRARPGRLGDFMGHVMESLPHIERMGGLARVLQSVIGLHPLTVMVSTAFADLEAYGAYADKIASDEQWQSFWLSVMADPTADLVRSGLLVDISGD